MYVYTYMYIYIYMYTYIHVYTHSSQTVVAEVIDVEESEQEHDGRCING